MNNETLYFVMKDKDYVTHYEYSGGFIAKFEKEVGFMVDDNFVKYTETTYRRYPDDGSIEIIQPKSIVTATERFGSNSCTIGGNQ